MTLKSPATELAKKFYNLKAPRDVANLLEFKNYGFLKYILFVAPHHKRYSESFIPKKRGGERKLLIPSSELKFVQQRLLQVLQVVYKPKRSVRGFTYGESIVSNARDHVGKRYVLNVDLKDFFPSIHFGRVRGMFMNYPYSLNDKVATVLAQICSLETELPQGAPTSPIISNMICAKLDSQLIRLAKKTGCYYTRYADDLTFSTAKKTFPLSLAKKEGNQRVIAGKKLEKIIHDNGFRVNPEKICLQTRYGHQEVTGLTVNKKVNVKRKSVRQIRAMLHAWEKYGYTAAESDHPKYNYKFQYDSSYEPSFQKVVKGKSEFIGLVRGKDDSIYIRFNNKAHELELKDKLSPQLFSFIEPPENSENEKIFQLIQAGENDEVEFKESAYLNRHTGKEDKKLRLKISEEIAAFMNTHPEGTLLIGVTDSGEVIGIEREYKTANPQKGNWDGYKLALSDTLEQNMEKGNIHDFYTISQCSISGKNICCIRTRKVDSPVLVKDKLFHRVGTQCKQLKGENIINFIQDFNQNYL